MDKMRFESPDLTAENISKITAMFPGVVTEGKVNFDLLRPCVEENKNWNTTENLYIEGEGDLI